MILMNGCPYRSSCYMERGLEMSLVVVNGFQEVQAPAVDGSTYPRHKKIQLYEIYVRWTSKLSLLSLFAAVNRDIYQQETINKVLDKMLKVT
jgi:hypothetical protein